MPINESYQRIRYAYRCEVCGRHFESDGPWAHESVTRCEVECREKLPEGLVRVFLPPPGRSDSMFQDRHWKFVEMYSAESVCAEKGHDEESTWTPYHDGAEMETIRCKRCGVEGHGSIRGPENKEQSK